MVRSRSPVVDPWFMSFGDTIRNSRDRRTGRPAKALQAAGGQLQAKPGTRPSLPGRHRLPPQRGHLLLATCHLSPVTWNRSLVSGTPYETRRLARMRDPRKRCRLQVSGSREDRRRPGFRRRHRPFLGHPAAPATSGHPPAIRQRRSTTHDRTQGRRNGVPCRARFAGACPPRRTRRARRGFFGERFKKAVPSGAFVVFVVHSFPPMRRMLRSRSRSRFRFRWPQLPAIRDPPARLDRLGKIP